MKFLLFLNLRRVFGPNNRYLLLFVLFFVFAVGYSQEYTNIKKDSLLSEYEVKGNIKKRELTDLYFIINQNHQFKTYKKYIRKICVRYLEIAFNKEIYESHIYEIELSEKVTSKHFHKDFYPIKIIPISKAPISYYAFNKNEKKIIIAGIYGSFLHFEEISKTSQMDFQTFLKALQNYL